MFAYDFDRLNTFLKKVLQANLTGDAWNWLANEGESVRAKKDIAKFNVAFVAMPRKTGKDVIQISESEQAELKNIRADFTVADWTRDRLGRVWLLMQLDPQDKDRYVGTIENLFLSAEMSELVALYSALPVLAYPDAWRKRCAEGIRNNIGQVLEAVICDNPYPSEHLDELAWNQLVLKAVFTEKPLLRIVGLTKRTNRNLVQSLSDYAHERWAAHRDVNPLLWICVPPFVDTHIFADIQRLFSSGDILERDAAALVCHETDYEPAKQLLDQYPDMRNAVKNGATTWEQIASRMAVRV